MNENYLILDIETESKDYRSRFSDPLDRRNKVVMIQTLSYGESNIYYEDGKDLRDQAIDIKNIDVIVGQNIKYDLLYLWKNKSIIDFLKKGGHIWDTKTVDYLLNACRKDLRYSLDDLAFRWDVEAKYAPIKGLYKGDKVLKRKPMTTMEIIAQEGLKEFTKYALQDVLTTEGCYLRQLQEATEEGMLNLIHSYMRYYLTIIETEFNGLFVNDELLVSRSEHYHSMVNKFNIEAREIIRKNKLWPDEVEININSPSHISFLLFGGLLTATIRSPRLDVEGNPIVYKSGAKEGQTATSLQKKKFHIPGMRCPTKITKKTTKDGVWATDVKILEEAINHVDKEDYKLLLKTIIVYKQTDKLNTDCIKKIRDNINPYTWCLHSEFNTTSTTTGRLSSSNPGSQNLHPLTLDFFTSRYGKEGVIVEFDWSQVEVAMAAYIFNDPILKEEILSGVDMHLENASLLYNIPKEKIHPKQRKTAKFMTFGILYGQSSYGLSKSHDIEEYVAEGFISAFFNKYKQIHKAHKNLEVLITKNAQWKDNKGHCFLKSPTSKLYYFATYPSSRYGESFNASQYKNYILQGTAGDLHAYCVGKLWPILLQNRDNFAIINNVHDSIIFDVRIQYLDSFKDTIKSIMEDSAREYTGTDLFTLDCKVGRSWGDAKK